MEVPKSSVSRESSSFGAAGPGHIAVAQTDRVATVFSFKTLTAGLSELVFGRSSKQTNQAPSDHQAKSYSPFVGTETDSITHMSRFSGESIEKFKASLSETLAKMETIPITQSEIGIMTLNPEFANLSMALTEILYQGQKFTADQRTQVAKNLDTKYDGQTSELLMSTIIGKLKASDFEFIKILGTDLETFFSEQPQIATAHQQQDYAPPIPMAIGYTYLITNSSDMPPPQGRFPSVSRNPTGVPGQNNRASLQTDSDRSLALPMQHILQIQQGITKFIDQDPSRIVRMLPAGQSVTAKAIANMALGYAGLDATDIKTWFNNQSQSVQQQIMQVFQEIADSINRNRASLTGTQPPSGTDAHLGVGKGVIPSGPSGSDITWTGNSKFTFRDQRIELGPIPIWGQPPQKPSGQVNPNPGGRIFIDDVALNKPNDGSETRDESNLHDDSGTLIVASAQQPRVLSREALIAAIKKDQGMAPGTQSALLAVISSQNILPEDHGFQLALSIKLRQTSPLEGFKQEPLRMQIAQAMAFLESLEAHHTAGRIEDAPPTVESKRSKSSLEELGIEHLRQQLVTNPAKTKDLLHNLVALRRAHDTVINRGTADSGELARVMDSLQSSCNAVKVALADRPTPTTAEDSTSEDPETKLMHDFQVSAETILKCLETTNPKISGALQIAMLYSVTASLDQLIDSSVDGNKLQFKANTPAMATIDASAPDANISLLGKPYDRDSSTVFSILYDTNINTQKIAIKTHDRFDFPDHMMGDNIEFPRLIIRSAQEAGITDSAAPISIDSAKHWMMTIGTALTSPTVDGWHLDSGHVALGTKIIEGISEWAPPKEPLRSLDDWVEQFKTDKMNNEDDKSVCERFHNALKKAALPGSPSNVSTNFDEVD